VVLRTRARRKPKRTGRLKRTRDVKKGLLPYRNHAVAGEKKTAGFQRLLFRNRGLRLNQDKKGLNWPN
jgi:hypothetical protein